MIGVSFNFADMESRRGDEVGQILFADFNQKVGIIHRPPKLSLDQVTLEGCRQLLERVHHEMVNADVRAVPVAFVGE